MTNTLSFKLTHSAFTEEALNKITSETTVKYRSNDHNQSPALIRNNAFCHPSAEFLCKRLYPAIQAPSERIILFFELPETHAEVVCLSCVWSQ